LQTIATALDPWQEPQVAGATMGESRISADWLLSGANTLDVVAPANDQRRLSGVFAALVSHIVAGAYERSAKTGRPIEPALLLALDEVCNIAPLSNLDEIASTGPGQGVHLLCVLQNISQGYDRWGRDRAETIIANHRARLFCSGIGDRATLDYLRGTLGEEEIARMSTQQRSIATPGSKTRSTEHRPLATPHRIRQADRSSSLLVYGRLAPAWITAANAVAADNGAAQISDDGEMWTTRRVAAHYGVAVGFIYQHADELGCVRLGGTARPRLRFDPAVVGERWPSVGGGAPELLPTRRRTTSSTSAARRRGARASHELLDFDREP
jgi:TraM recognition site of TraD and TraG